MELILARHGNTFRKGDPVVWVGSQNDLPLVETGELQAAILGQLLRQTNTIPASVYTGPLRRMTSFAAIALKELQASIKPVVDLRLNEIDYGKWGGLTRDEICMQFGQEAFERWEKKSQWPKDAGWGESEALVIARIKEFAHALISRYVNNETILVVASNGCLRYFLDLITGQLQRYIDNNTVKMATGHISKLTYHNGQWTIDFWNKSPKQMLEEREGQHGLQANH